MALISSRQAMTSMLQKCFVYMIAVLGGQKSRVAFAKITFKKPHIILLDEPSNHLVSYQSASFVPVFMSYISCLQELYFLSSNCVDKSKGK